MRRVTRSVVAMAAVVCLASIALTAQDQGTSAGRAPANLVNLNTASADQLESLPGIGPKTAGRIIEYRQKHGGFKKVEELMNVQGVGEKSFLKLKHLITVTPPRADRATGIAA